jgi:hypothetical protein
MSTLAHNAAAVEIRTLGKSNARAANRLTLRPTADGWSLLGPGGEVVCHGRGIAGRRVCLEYARARGVLAVFS